MEDKQMMYKEVKHLSYYRLNALRQEVRKVMVELSTYWDNQTKYSAKWQELRKIERATTIEIADRWRKTHNGEYTEF